MFSELFTRRQLLNILKWTLYGALFLITMLVQSIVLPRIPVGGVVLCTVPITVVCVAVREETFAATLYSLICGFVFCLSGADCGPIYIVMLTIAAALTGGCCEHYYTRSFIPGLLLSLMSLTLAEGAAFLFRVYVGTLSAGFWRTVLLPEILLSALCFPPIYLAAFAISRLGGTT